MAEPLTLYGYHYSVYVRVVRMALSEMGHDATYVEADPFSDPPDPRLANLTEFNRVPVLRHGVFVLTETAAILRYLDTIGNRPSLLPTAPKASARMAQVIGIIDNYGYQPLIRQVFGNSVFRPIMGEPADPAQVAAGCSAAQPVLRALDSIIAEGIILRGPLSLADLHLAPMIAYFDMTPEGHGALAQYAHLSEWWVHRKGLPSLSETDPFFADLAIARDQGADDTH